MSAPRRRYNSPIDRSTMIAKAVREAKSDDKAAQQRGFSVIWSNYVGVSAVIAARLSVPAHLIEDAMQAAQMAVWQAIQSFDLGFTSTGGDDAIAANFYQWASRWILNTVSLEKRRSLKQEVPRMHVYTDDDCLVHHKNGRKLLPRSMMVAGDAKIWQDGSATTVLSLVADESFEGTDVVHSKRTTQRLLSRINTVGVDMGAAKSRTQNREMLDGRLINPAVHGEPIETNADIGRRHGVSRESVRTRYDRIEARLRSDAHIRALYVEVFGCDPPTDATKS